MTDDHPVDHAELAALATRLADDLRSAGNPVTAGYIERLLAEVADLREQEAETRRFLLNEEGCSAGWQVRAEAAEAKVEELTAERDAARASGWNEGRSELLPMLDAERALADGLAEKVRGLADEWRSAAEGGRRAASRQPDHAEHHEALAENYDYFAIRLRALVNSGEPYDLTPEQVDAAQACATCGVRRDEHHDQSIQSKFPALDITDHLFADSGEGSGD